MPNQNVTALLNAARETAVAAGALIKARLSQPRTITEKAFQDFVTDADLAAQQLVTDRLRAQFPTHGFLTEEEDKRLPTDGPLLWIIDPVDGTTNYSRRQPLFCVSIAVVQPGAHAAALRPLAGAVYDPMRDELFSAATGSGCWLNGNAITVSSIDTLDYTIIGVDWSRNKRMNRSSRDVLPQFAQTVQGVRSLGSAALAMAWVAAGRYDGYLNYNLKPWDVAAAWVLLQEAGGRITNTNGDEAAWRLDGMDCFLSNGRIHDKFLRRLSPQTLPQIDQPAL